MTSNEQADANSATSGGSLQGLEVDVANRAELFRALDKAFDYRGDVSLLLDDGSAIEGYIFDRRTGQGLEDSFVRIIPTDSDRKLEVLYSRITALKFTGKDAAHGKSWENWVKRYVERKRAGQKASIDAEPLA